MSRTSSRHGDSATPVALTAARLSFERFDLAGSDRRRRPRFGERDRDGAADDRD